MKYRSPTGEPLRVATTAGHTAILDDQWQELPKVFHQAALLHGAEVDQAVTVADAAPPQSAGPTGQDVDAIIERALKVMLERDQEGDFNAADEPNLKVLSKLAGLRVTREQVSPIYHRLVEEAEDADDAPAAGESEGAAG